MSRWLVTGARGMLGRDVVDVAKRSGHTVLGLSRKELDIVDADAVSYAVESADVVINCAAWTDVDSAEAHEAEAFGVNAVGAANVARACHATGAVMVQISTDYVFSGHASEPYPVDAPLSPINAYGRTKAAGEWAVRAECPRSYVVRTSWLYGHHGRNFVTTILKLAKEKEHLQVVNDQHGQPTWTRDVADWLTSLMAARPPFGTLHATSSGSTTWWGIATAACEMSGFDTIRVHGCSSSAFPRPAQRPSYSTLSGANHSGLEAIRHWREALLAFLQSHELLHR